jgi:CheY-like chemotaxis protein
MTPKRALVVDDSRSARAFLSRILERHSLEVDTAESAEAALEYLKRTRPDVIFMDHLMPGMDGFQAVQLIKKDPRTAMIPILMYTSQEGELYLSQARALGALGVLPKQTRPADVTKALLQLHLVESEPGQGGELSTTAISNTGTLPIVPPELRDLVQAMLRDKSDEMRRFVMHSLDEHANKVEGHVRGILEETAANRQPPPKAPVARVTSGLMLGFSLLGLLAAGALAWVWYQATVQQSALNVRLQELETQLADAKGRLEAARAELAERIAAAATAAVRAEPPLLQEALALGEAPLSGNRVELVRTQLEKLFASGYKGRVELRVMPARFCLKSGPGEPLALADADMPYAKCTEMTESQLGALAAQRESVSFANMLAAFRKRAGDAVQVQTTPGTVAETAVPYPQVTDALTAGEWNRVAAQNFRLELRTPPANPPSPAPAPVTAAAAATAPNGTD